MPQEIERREDRLAKLKKAKQAIEERAKERFEAEKAEHEAKLAARKAKEKQTGRKSHSVAAFAESLTAAGFGDIGLRLC